MLVMNLAQEQHTVSESNECGGRKNAHMFLHWGEKYVICLFLGKTIQRLFDLFEVTCSVTLCVRRSVTRFLF